MEFIEKDNPKLVEFLKTVFQDMKLRHDVTDAVNLASPGRARAEPYARFKQQLNVMYRALDPMHRSGFETLFTFLTLNEFNAYSLMSAHCIAIWEECEEGSDVFLHLMYTCSFAYSLLAYCESKGMPNFLSLFTKWIAVVYYDQIQLKFEAENGLEGLDEFCSSLNLHLILDFINLCYNKQGKLFTYITIKNSMSFFGLHHDDTIAILKDNFKEFKNSIFTEFKNELNSYMKYKIGVMLACIKIELGLKKIAGVFNPSGPSARLLDPTLTLLKDHLLKPLGKNLPASIKRTIARQERVRAKQKQAFARHELTRINQARDLIIQELARVNQEQARVTQEQDRINQELVLTRQEKARINQKYASVCQEQGYIDQEQCYTNQNCDHNNPEIAHLLQELARINQKRVRTIQERVRIIQERNRAHQEALAHHWQARAKQESLNNNQCKARLHHGQTLTYQQLQQVLNTVEESSDTVEKTSGIANVEQAVKISLNREEHIPDGEESSFIKIRNAPLRRLVLIEDPNHYVNCDSDTEEHCSCCPRANK